MNFYRRCLSTFSRTWCKNVKNDQKLKSRGSCLNCGKLSFCLPVCHIHVQGITLHVNASITPGRGWLLTLLPSQFSFWFFSCQTLDKISQLEIVSLNHVADGCIYNPVIAFPPRHNSFFVIFCLPHFFAWRSIKKICCNSERAEAAILVKKVVQITNDIDCWNCNKCTYLYSGSLNTPQYWLLFGDSIKSAKCSLRYFHSSHCVRQKRCAASTNSASPSHGLVWFER